MLDRGVEAAFRAALVDSVAGLALRDRNLIDFHHGRGVGIDRLAAMFGTPRAAIVRQLDRIRARLLRDTRRGLAARMPLERDELDGVIELADRRFAWVLARVLR